MTIDWHKYVDHIYIVDYVNTPEEVNKYFNKELIRVGINRYDTDFVTTFENINSPLYQTLYNTFVNKTEVIDYDYAYDVTIAHYYCMKLAQAKNHQRILILENDGIYYDDLHVIEDILNQVKIGFDNDEIDLFCGSLGMMYDNAAEIDYTNTKIYKYTNYDIFCGGAAFNIYNSKAYNVFIDYIENKNYSVIDQYSIIYYKKDINIWYSHVMICVQKWWDLLMFNLYEHYNMIEPSEEKIIENYRNIFVNQIGWADNRNVVQIFVNCLEHFKLTNKYNNIYQYCKIFLSVPGNNEKYLYQNEYSKS